VNWGLTIVAGAVLGVAVVSRLLTGTPVTAAIVFVIVGVVAGPLVLDDLAVPPDGQTVRTLAEATLAVVLFSDAARIDLRALRRQAAVPVRLLGVGLPLTITLGTLAALPLFGHLSLSDAVILAVILAPTDAGLGQAVVTDPRLPQRVRQSLNVESGLNDGICVPLLLIVLATASGSHAHGHVVLEEIGWGIAGGLAAGLLGSQLTNLARSRNLIAGAWLQLIPVASAALAYGIAVGLGGSGFIAAFVAGMLFGNLLRGETVEVTAFAEQSGTLLDGVTFLVFGAVLLGPTLEHLTWQMLVYGALSLTVVRLAPVALSLLGTRARAPTVALLGWFGPRGLATIVFAVIVQDSGLPHTQTIVATAYVAVGLSVFLHGLSAAPSVDRYTRWYRAHPAGRPPAMEFAPAPELRTRGPTRPQPQPAPDAAP
jgi:NhaP-type Na+/H+ or K+/H+ antiporter